jgi:hypothetical protein
VLALEGDPLLGRQSLDDLARLLEAAQAGAGVEQVDPIGLVLVLLPPGSWVGPLTSSAFGMKWSANQTPSHPVSSARRAMVTMSSQG